MPAKEAQARIKINKLLEEAGWRFFDDATGKANVVLEPTVKLTKTRIDALGDDFQKTGKGFIDFLLIDAKGFPIAVLEAKAEDKHPLVGKEQARTYARSQNCRFVILSNGNLHYFWDLTQGNPYQITKFPDPASVVGYQKYQPDPQKLIQERVERDYIVLTQRPTYQQEAGWKNEAEQESFSQANKLRFLRDYQQRAIHAIQKAVAGGADRFLFEMATGTGKTLTAAAVIKLFLRSGNARRVLFLVDRLELEEQAHKAFGDLLKNDYTTVVYKENRDDWRKAEIVVTTVQSLLFNNKYKRLFSPTDFDLIISDEAHRSIGGNARAVFEYFVGYKLGLTATPKDYLKRFDQENPTTSDPREVERRLLLDTYRTFGCADGQPTFRYSLLDGVRERYLINPLVVDARTDVTTQLLSADGYLVELTNDEGEESEAAYKQRDFEKKFFSADTNRLFCQTFLDNALRDPISDEIGKSIVFAVSQHHALKLTQILNELADAMFPGWYQADFAVQVTSQIAEAQQYTINFTNNKLLGQANVVPEYKTSKARVCVTVGMMTTGYDCPDLLNLCLMRPIFSPTDFIQIKGRGTRKHDFMAELMDGDFKSDLQLARHPTEKGHYKLFDFFANCEFFEKEFDYDQVLTLPRPGTGQADGGDEGGIIYPMRGEFENVDPDRLVLLKEQQIGVTGMKIDRMFYQKFEEQVKADAIVQQQVADGQWEQVIDYVSTEILNKPLDYFTIDKLRKAAGVDRRLSLREILEKAFGFIPRFKSKDELLEEAFEQFVLDRKPADPQTIIPIKYFFKAYVTDGWVRQIIEEKRLTELHTHPGFTMADYRAVPPDWRNVVPEYVKDYVVLNQFM